MTKSKVKDTLEKLTQDALTKNEIMLESLIQYLIDSEVIVEEELKRIYEENIAKTTEKLKRIHDEMQKVFKEMQEKALEDKLNDPNDNCGNC